MNNEVKKSIDDAYKAFIEKQIAAMERQIDVRIKRLNELQSIHDEIVRSVL